MKIAGIVLAGGLSSRMGSDKAQLQLDNQTLLARNVALLASLPLQNHFVSGEYEGYHCIADLAPELGPLGGLQASVESLLGKYDAIFVIPVDMPLLSIDECEQLLQQFEHFPQGVFYQDAIFPMLLPLTEQLKDYLTDVLTSSDNKQRSLYRLLKTFKLQPIDYQDEAQFRFQNSNTPQQWQACLEKHASLKKETNNKNHKLKEQS